MLRGKRTAISHAAEAKAVADIGHQGTQVAEATGLPARTVADIINGRARWGDIIANDQAFKHYRSDAKRKMQAASIKLSQKALQQIETESIRPVRHRQQWFTASCGIKKG